MITRGQPLGGRHRSDERPVFPPFWLAVGVSSSIHAIGVIALPTLLTNDTVVQQPKLTIQLVHETTLEIKTEAIGASPFRPTTEFSLLNYQPVFLSEPAPTQQPSLPLKLLEPINLPIVPTPEITVNEVTTTALTTPPSSKSPPSPTTLVAQVKPIINYNTFLAFESLVTPTSVHLELDTQRTYTKMSFPQIKEPEVQNLTSGDGAHPPKLLNEHQRIALAQLPPPMTHPEVSNPKGFTRASPPAPPALLIHDNTFSNLQMPPPVNKEIHPVESLPAKILRETTASYRNPEFGNKPPEYPRHARRHGLEGRVVISVTVSASGRPRKVRIEETSGIEVLDDAARKAIEKWRFSPAYRHGIAVDSNVVIPVVFRLEN